MNNSLEAETAVTLTESAASHIKELLASETDDRKKSLRVYVEGGGCSGLQYGMVLDEKREGDLVTDCGDVPVLVDAFSLNYLRGTVVDFEDSLNGGGFKISNPNARQSCGCGKSFEA